MRLDLPKLSALERAGFACPHCGNVVASRGVCPMRFPLPDCLTPEAAAEAKRAAGRPAVKEEGNG
jgi:hypothetical protein